ncbi:MAG TPA: extracellular solute-binding protein [Chloroflexia bacterium]|nr:extracellular solute-binding protein [Chloroflexia bacterium]
MFQDNERGKIRRRSILRTVSRAGRVALLGCILVACGGTAATPTTVPATAAPTATAAAAAPTATTATSGAATATTAATSAPTVASAATATTEATSAPVAGDQVVNMLWTDTSNLRQPLIADFTKATGIKVNQVQVQYNELLDKINTSVQGGGDVDVVEMDTIWTAQFASAGWIDDLSTQIDDPLKKDIPASALGAVTYQGKIYGMPWYNSAKHLFYNAKLLKDAGFSSPPTTLDEFTQQAQATTKPGHQWGSVWGWKQAEGLVCDWVAIMFTNKDAQILDENGKAVFNTHGGTEALQWMVDMLYKYKAADPASLEYTEADVQKAFQTGTYALTYNWEGDLPADNDPTQSKAAPNVRVALLPGSKDVRSSSVNGSEGWAILKQAKHKEAAWKLLQYMASPAWQKKSAIIAGDYPILSSLYSDPDLQKQVQDFSVYGEQFKYLAIRPQVPGYAQKSDIIQKHLHEALLGKVSPKDAMDAAAAEVNNASNAP